MAKYQLGEWNVTGNVLMKTYGKFDLVVIMGSVSNEDYEFDYDYDEQVVNPFDIVFILRVFNKQENLDMSSEEKYYIGNNITCAFATYEDLIFFINNYLVDCNSLGDISSHYTGFISSKEVTDRRGLKS